MAEDWRYRREPDGLGFTDYVSIAVAILLLAIAAVCAASFVLMRLL